MSSPLIHLNAPDAKASASTLGDDVLLDIAKFD